MAQIKFGTSQLKAPTPAGVSKAIDLISALSGAVIGWSATTDIIQLSTRREIAGIGGLIITCALVIKPYFGVNVTTPTVDVKDVTEVEQSASEK